MPRVREVMREDIACIASSDSIAQAARRMRDCEIDVIPVCENGKFCGVVAERDIVTGVIAAGMDPRAESAGPWVQTYPSISPDEELSQAAKAMMNHQVRALPVVQRGKLLGLITLNDLARESMALGAVVFANTARTRCNRGMKQDRQPVY